MRYTCGTVLFQLYLIYMYSKYPVFHYTVDPSSRVYVMVINILDQSTCCAFRTIRTTNPSPYWTKFCTLAEQYWWLILILVYFITPRGSLLSGPNTYHANMLHLTFLDELGREQKDTFLFSLNWVDACYISWFQNGLGDKKIRLHSTLNESKLVFISSKSILPLIELNLLQIKFSPTL